MNVVGLTLLVAVISNLLIAAAMAARAEMNALRWVATGFTALLIGILLGTLFAWIASKILRMPEKYLPWSLLAYMIVPFVGVAVSLVVAPLSVGLVLSLLK